MDPRQKKTIELLGYALTGNFARTPQDIALAMLTTAARELMTIQHGMNTDTHDIVMPDQEDLQCEMGDLSRRMEAAASIVRALERGEVAIAWHPAVLDDEPKGAEQ